MRRCFLPAVTLLAVLPGPGMAQNTDAAYCARLAELVTRYVGKQINGQNRPDSDSLVAMDRCDHGDTATGIPILEKKLLNGGFTLPPR
ncbi:MAG: hypothetical protein KIS73_01945 [Enhydrobacter sp.]|nr:hypothetical protein [Enhydrobacter sp.]